ncbi:hypothetical protein J2R96_000883 [Bradyrhizobium elkanii]|nr:hypothetical protein [Bradyrhizobium elkanii]
MRLAMLDYFVLGLAGLLDVEVVLARKPVVPTAVPGSEKVGVSLPCSGELRAGQLLNVQIAFALA